MRIYGFYNAAEDRVLLKLEDLPQAGNLHFWFTRRQCLAIALACQRVRSDVFDPGVSRPLRSGTQQTVNSGSESYDPVNVALVSAVKFRRIPDGLRLELSTAAPEPFVLLLKGDSLASFEALINRLGSVAKWDMPAGLLRMDAGGQATPQKHLLH